MRDNRHKWQFYSHPSKRVLSPREVIYWKNLLASLIKIGLEFEFNLPEQKGSCKGNNIQCPCANLNNDCWLNCANLNDCRKNPQPEICANRNDDCTSESCKKCKHFSHMCLGIYCVDFVSACFDCDQFVKNCDTCVKRYDPKKDPSHIRNTIQKEFRPTNTYGTVGKTGVVRVEKDGSLLGDKGVEIITVGRRVDYWEFYGMSKKIIERASELGAYLNERCGAHMHVLASYFEEGSNINELEKNLPAIVLANFHQLCRRYQNAMVWMTIALDNPNHMTRWEKFRVSILDFSAVNRDANKLIQDICNYGHQMSGGNGSKYGWVNYKQCKVADNGDISRFHIEMRGADATMCPSYYAAMACLYYALVIKAVEISRYGTLKVGDESWMAKAKKMKSIILNGTGDYGNKRLGDTSKLLDNQGYFIEESIDLLVQLKSILMRFGPAYDVLMKLAQRPIALRRIDGESWKEIEESIGSQLSESGQLEYKLREIIDLRIVEDCGSVTEWITAVHNIINEDADIDPVEKPDVESFVETMMREGEAVWSDSTGTLLAI